ncbi:MAG: alanine racemase [Glaciecola sp.]
MTDPLRPTVAEINVAAIRANVRTIAAAASAEVCAVVKADGYGHGAARSAWAAVEGGATSVAVAMVEEGEQLRWAGIVVPILVLAEPPLAAVDRMLAAKLTPVVYSPEMMAALSAAASAAKPIDIHVKADTGMHRVGVSAPDWASFLDAASQAPGLRIAGLMTHLACADELESPANVHQLDAFDDFLALAASRDIRPEQIHAANTAGALILPRSRHTMVRAGIGIYGLSASPEVTAEAHGLLPALTWSTRVSFAKQLPAGEAASYGHRWAAPVDGWLATLPVGYADGIPRRVGGRIDVIVGGTRKPIVGTVCMDQTLVWCGDDPVARGDDVVLLGAGGDVAVTADDWALAADTITYEIACGIQKRVPRTSVDRER